MYARPEQADHQNGHTETNQKTPLACPFCLSLTDNPYDLGIQQ